MVSANIRSKEMIESLSEDLSRLSSNDADAPAQQLAKEIQESFN